MLPLLTKTEWDICTCNIHDVILTTVSGLYKPCYYHKLDGW